MFSSHMDGNDMEDLAIDEEDFTIKALPDNTTRMLLCYSGLTRWANLATARILRGVLLLEFLHENSEED